MNLHMIIEHAHDTICREDSSEANTVPKGTKLCSQAQAIVNNIYNYFEHLKNIVQVKVLYESQEVSHEIYELTSANLDGESVRM